jgi:hypothetical protein
MTMDLSYLKKLTSEFTWLRFSGRVEQGCQPLEMHNPMTGSLEICSLVLRQRLVSQDRDVLDFQSLNTNDYPPLKE